MGTLSVQPPHSTMVQITGNYTQVSKEGYEEFLKALGCGFILRKAAMASTPVMSITEDGGNWTMITKTSVKSIELRFKLGRSSRRTPQTAGTVRLRSHCLGTR